MDQRQLSFFAGILALATISAGPAPQTGMLEQSVRPEVRPKIVVPVAVDLPYRQIVDPLRKRNGSTSVGDTSDGELLDARRLPNESPVHYVLGDHRERPTHYSTDEMIGLLLDAAGHAAGKNSGFRLGIGNMSAPEGGDIEWSASHNNGRDADVAFPFRDATGKLVEVPTLIEVKRDGTPKAGPALTFDVPAGWDIVEGLLRSEHAEIQWIFVYAPLKAKLLEHARRIGADPEILARAEEVLHQPSDSANHNDHFHVRIACTRDDRLEGCVNRGPDWEWIENYDDEVARRVDELLRGTMDSDPEVGSAAVAYLDRLDVPERALDLAAALPYQAPSTQLRTIDLLAQWDSRGVAFPLIALAQSSPEDEVRVKALWALGRLADQASGPALAELIRVGGRPLASGQSLRAAAADAHRNIYSAESVPALIEALSDASPDTRAAVARVLHRVTGQVSPAEPGQALSADQLNTVVTFWTEWYAQHGQDPREEWLRRAFNEAGYAVSDLRSRSSLRQLARAVNDRRDELAFNADRLLVQFTGEWTPSENWSKDRRVRFWRDVVD